MSTAAQSLGARNEWARIVWPLVLLCLVVVLYAPVLKALLIQWWKDPDYSHGFLVPLFSGYIVWRQRQHWINIEPRPSNSGLIVILGAIILLLAGSLGAELFTSRFSLLILIAGMILFLSGWKVLRAVSFPVGFLMLMIPIPAVIYNQITFPLQLIATHFASLGLEAIRVPVLREGNVLALPNYSLDVVEACSGIRSLMSLIALAIAYVYLAENRRWVQYVVVVLMVPGAIITNAIRISGAGVLAYNLGPAAAEGFLHGFSDWIMFMIAFVLMFFCHWIVRYIGKRCEAGAYV